jgi:two-component system KDP operon response regulator KdpE
VPEVHPFSVGSRLVLLLRRFDAGNIMHIRASAPSRVGPFSWQPLVLVVAHELEQGRSLASALAVHGLRSLQVGLAPGDLTSALAHSPDLVVFDARGSTDRVAIVGRLRGGTGAPIVVLANAGPSAGAALLQAGASECLFRPSGPAALVVRARSWLRHGPLEPPPASKLDPVRERLRVDRERRAIFVEGRPVHITPLEAKLVTTLAQSGARPMREEQIVEAVWGRSAGRRVGYLRALVRQVRQKIEPDPASPQHLVDTPGGYRLRLS